MVAATISRIALMLIAPTIYDLVDEGHPVEVRELRVGLEALDGREVKRGVPRGEVVGAARIGGHRALVPAALVAPAELDGDILCDLERVLRVEAHRLAVVLVLGVAVAVGGSSPVGGVVAVVAESRAESFFGIAVRVGATTQFRRVFQWNKLRGISS